jgi:hypothetical protein
MFGMRMSFTPEMVLVLLSKSLRETPVIKPSPFGRGKGEGNHRGKTIHPYLDPLPEGKEGEATGRAWLITIQTSDFARFG